MECPFGVEHPLPKDARFGGRNRSFPIIILIRDQHVFDIGWMVEDIHGGVTLPQEEFNDKPHRKFDHIAVTLTVNEKPQTVSEKMRVASQPTSDRRARRGTRHVRQTR